MIAIEVVMIATIVIATESATEIAMTETETPGGDDNDAEIAVYYGV